MTTDDKTEELLQRLRDKGFRITSQRETVIRIFQENKEKHLSAEDVYEILSKSNEAISLATTYRTLRMLVDMNVLRELDFAETHKHYELIDENEAPHHHIICLDCNHTIEFENDEINELGKKIAKQYNVDIVDMQFQIFGKCPSIPKDDNRKHRH
ncbi:MAG: transcriptional repressor [Candidatus Caenarcaniphilales bacterium]|nr:transcriptional repressor [Candidatus Caenarcaniphilales bacterium]